MSNPRRSDRVGNTAMPSAIARQFSPLVVLSMEVYPWGVRDVILTHRHTADPHQIAATFRTIPALLATPLIDAGSPCALRSPRRVFVAVSLQWSPRKLNIVAPSDRRAGDHAVAGSSRERSSPNHGPALGRTQSLDDAATRPRNRRAPRREHASSAIDAGGGSGRRRGAVRAAFSQPVAMGGKRWLPGVVLPRLRALRRHSPRVRRSTISDSGRHTTPRSSRRECSCLWG